MSSKRHGRRASSSGWRKINCLGLRDDLDGAIQVMNPDAALRDLLLALALCPGLTQSAIACNDISANVKPQEREPPNRTFLLALQLTKPGKVRAVQVLMGEGPLRTEAIKAARRRIYRPRPGYASGVTGVQVKFAHGSTVPEIRDAMVGGVPSCVYAGAPIQSPLTTWVNQLLSNKLALPFILPSDSPPQ
jgi:hypothetical protein